MTNWDDIKKLEYSKKLGVEQGYFYLLFCNLFLVAFDKGLRLIVENPYNAQSYLNMHFPIIPSLVDLDRTMLGDKFKKPTQYWFINCEVQNNCLFDKQVFVFGKKHNAKRERVYDNSGLGRSLIAPKYAENFIKKYILESEVMPNDKKVTNP